MGNLVKDNKCFEEGASLEKVQEDLLEINQKLEKKLDRSGGTFTGSVDVNGGMTINSVGTSKGLELSGDSPYLDFHYGGSTKDFTSRIIEDSEGHITIDANNGIQLKCDPAKIKMGMSNTGYDSINYYFVQNAHNGHAVCLTWQDSGKLELSIDNSSQGYVQLSTTSDKRLKDDIQEIDENVVKAIGEVKLKQFKVTRNNKAEKISFGVIAQELRASFEKYNLNVMDYNLIDTIVYEDGVEYFIVNYEQFSILRMAYLESKLV